MKCPQCSKPLKRWQFDIGHGVRVPSLHCTYCQFNVTDEAALKEQLSKVRERLSKEVKVVAIGDGLGIRFPKGLVEEYGIKKGARLRLKPGESGVEVIL